MRYPSGIPSAKADRGESSSVVVVPPGAPRWVTPELLEHTLRVWQRYYKNPLTVDDALGMILSASQLNSVLTGGQHHEAVRRVGAGEQS